MSKVERGGVQADLNGDSDQHAPQTFGKPTNCAEEDESGVWGMVEFKSHQKPDGADMEVSHEGLHASVEKETKDAKVERRGVTGWKEQETKETRRQRGTGRHPNESAFLYGR